MHDFIIVGAGTAGCVLAHELTVSGRNRVLLVEAGGKPPLAAKIPAGMAKLFKSAADWDLECEPQAGCDGRVIYLPRGRMLGGCSNINAQIHQWCHPADYDGWVALGAEGWGWDAVAPVFRSMENWSGKAEGDQMRGGLGPMRIDRPRLECTLADDFVAAARAAGLEGQEDYNGCAYQGAWRTQQAHHEGRRFSVYNAYLEPAMKRPNFRVLKEKQVAHLLWEGKKAVGIALLDGSEHRAGRGVILCAGAFGTPQLLMLSGVGPAEALRGHGIEMVADSPEVGANLQEHPLAGLSFATKRPITLRGADGLLPLLQWLLLKRGPLSSNGVEAIAFTSVMDEKGPDLELIFANFEWLDQGLTPPRTHAYAIAASCVAPRSRGSLTLRSASPRDPPRIDFGFLTDEEGADARVMLEGLKLARRIAATEPLAGETIGELPGSAEAQDDAALTAWMKSEMQTVYHPSSTCRMGSDAGAPVDSELKVRGVEGLWAVDASVMPTVPRGHPNAVVAMIAKRAAEWIS